MQKFIGLFVVFSALATPAFSGDGRYQMVLVEDRNLATYIVINTNTGQTRYCIARNVGEKPYCSPWSD
jgi:hypothetical protein